MFATRRDLKAAVIAILLLIVGVSMAAAGVVWVRHVHHSNQEALLRNTSYRYGERIFDDRKVTSSATDERYPDALRRIWRTNCRPIVRGRSVQARPV
jgi:hypothetical protein